MLDVHVWRPAGSSTPDRAVDVLLAEKKARGDEMNEYNKRFEQVLNIYVTAVFAGLGLSATGKLQISSIATNEYRFELILAFAAMNVFILLHGINLSSWSMAHAQYIAVVLDPALRVAVPTVKNLESWDRSGLPLKRSAVNVRGGLFICWMFLILAVAIGAFALVKLSTLPNFSSGGRAFAVSAAVGIAALLLYVLHQGLTLRARSERFFSETPAVPWYEVWPVALLIWSGAVVSAVLLAVYA